MMSFSLIMIEENQLDPKDVARGWGGAAGDLGGSLLGGTAGALGGTILSGGNPIGTIAGASIGAGLGSGLGSYHGSRIAGELSTRKKVDKTKIFDRMGYLLAPTSDSNGAIFRVVS